MQRMLQAMSRGLIDSRLNQAVAASLVTVEERALTPDLARVVAAAIRIYSRIIGLPDVSEVLATGDLYAEVPFSLQKDGADGSASRTTRAWS